MAAVSLRRTLKADDKSLTIAKRVTCKLRPVSRFACPIFPSCELGIQQQNASLCQGLEDLRFTIRAAWRPTADLTLPVLSGWLGKHIRSCGLVWVFGLPFMSSFQGRALHDARNHCRGASQNHMPVLPVEKLSGVSSKTTFKTMMISNDFASFGSNVFCVHSFF